MFWGCITSDGPGPLVPVQGTMNSQKYVDILEHHILPLAAQGKILQQDNARCHTSARTRGFLQEHQVQLLDWPPYSPDMNLIENVWSLLKAKVAQQATTTREQLIQRVQEIWTTDDELSQMCRDIFDSMPNRVGILSRCRGGYTGY